MNKKGNSFNTGSESNTGKDEDEIHRRIENLVDNFEESGLELEEVPEEVVKRVESADENELEKIEREFGVEGDMSVEKLEKEYSESSLLGGVIGLEMGVDEGNSPEEEIEADYQDGRFEIKISEDKMSAKISLYPSLGGGIPLNLSKIKKTMEEMGIVYGVNFELLEKLVKKVEGAKEPREDVIIAKGTEPEEGEDGKIEYFFKETDDILRKDDSEWIVKNKD